MIESPMMERRHRLAFALIGAFLLTFGPILLSLDHWKRPDFLPRLLDSLTLYTLASSIFYISLYQNIRWYNHPRPQKIWYNVGLWLGLTGLSLLLHFPVWMRLDKVPIFVVVRDDFIRNSAIVLVSYGMAKFYITTLESHQIKVSYAELAKEHLSNQTSALMQQINPHFFFNTLNTLSGLVEESPEKSEIFIQKLSQVFRYILSMQEQSKVQLTEEIRFTQAYLYLLEVRFEGKLLFELDLDLMAFGRYQVPSLCSQLLIENVIKHNQMNQHAPVTIRFSVEEGFLKVQNTFRPQKTSAGMGLGLKNLNKRSELLFGKPISVASDAAFFTVKVPMLPPQRAFT